MIDATHTPICRALRNKVAVEASHSLGSWQGVFGPWKLDKNYLKRRFEK